MLQEEREGDLGGGEGENRKKMDFSISKMALSLFQEITKFP